MHDPRAIANRFIMIAIKENNPLTLMQILKLCYIAHGFCLAFLGKPLSKNNPEAWKFGPVFPEIYHSLKFYGNNPIKEVIKSIKVGSNDLFVSIIERFSHEEEEIILFVYENYGSLNGWELSSLTHQEGTPWHKVWEEEGNALGTKISDDEIKKHYLELFKR